MKKISQSNFFVIILPVIKKYTSSKDCVEPLRDLQEYFNKNGYVLNDESEDLISLAFAEIANIIRDGTFLVNSSDQLKQSYDQCYNFLQECTLEMSKWFQIPPVNEIESNEELEKQINLWFDGYKDVFNDTSDETHLFEFKNAQEYLEYLQNPELKLQKLKGLVPDEIVREVLYANADLRDSYGPLGQYVIDGTIPFMDAFADGVDEEQIKNLVIFFKNYPYVKKQIEVAAQIRRELKDLSDETKLAKFYDNPKFISDCKKLISVLTKYDRYHGTRYSSLESIRQNGLYMVQKNLNSTSIQMHCFYSFGDIDALLDMLLLYRTGTEGDRGDGVVFLREGAVVTSVPEDENIDVDYSMTGPIGVKYKVSPKDIIGTIDMVNQQVKFGPEFEKRNLEPES